jgi:recombination protein RecA
VPNPPPKKKLLESTSSEPKPSAEVEKLVAASVASIEKAFGKGTVMRLGDTRAAQIRKEDVISTGSLGLDIAIGVGGIPRGRIVEIFGPESAGKSSLSLHIVASAQKMGGICAYVDAENSLDTSYARNLGVNVDDLLVSQPDCGEQALEIVDQFVKGGGVSVIVIDSVAALTPRAEIEGEMGDAHVGLQARLMSQAMRKLTSNVSRSNTLIIFTNQTRQKIGVMWGSNETTTGGTALKFYASLRFEIKRIGALKVGVAEDATIIGNKTVVRVVKNKLAPPFRKAEFDIIYGKGISYESEVIDLGVVHGIIDKSGAWYSYGEDRLGQGRENTREFLAAVPKLTKEIASKIKAIGYKEIKSEKK